MEPAGENPYSAPESVLELGGRGASGDAARAISFRLTPDEHVQLAMRDLVATHRHRTALILGLVLCAFAYVTLTPPGGEGLPMDASIVFGLLAFIVVVGVYVLTVQLTLRMSLRRRYRVPFLSEPVRLSWTDARLSLESHSGNRRTRLDWTLFESTVEDDGFLRIYAPERVMYVWIPKRAFESEAQLADFRRASGLFAEASADPAGAGTA